MSFSISGKTVFVGAVVVAGCVMIADFADKASTSAVASDSEKVAVSQPGYQTVEQAAPQEADYDDQSSWGDDDDPDFADYDPDAADPQPSTNRPSRAVTVQRSASTQRMPIPALPRPEIME